ncbi:MAG: choice-of-anchor W domain-containing protein [Spirulina sp.]
MNGKRLLFSFLGGAIALILSNESAIAFTLTHLSSDAEMNAIMQDLAFVAEGRIGDRNGAATYELDLHEDHPGFPQMTDQFNWQNGVTEAFELSYTSTSNLVNFTIGDRVLSHAYTDPFSDIFIRTQAVKAGSHILLNNLQLNGTNLGEKSHAIAAEGGLDILQISEFGKDFQLTGEVTMNWEEIPPTQSRLAFQIKIADTGDTPTPRKEIPEPSLLVSLGCVSLLGLRSRRFCKE